MYRFIWPLCKISALLVLVWYYKARSDREQDLWRYRLSEGCIKQGCDKPLICGCLSNEVWGGGAWSSNHAVSCTLAKESNIQSENTVFETLCFTPLTSISSDTAVRSLIPLLFLSSLSSPIINICSCLQDLKLSLIGLYGVSSIYWVLLLQTSYISVSWL